MELRLREKKKRESKVGPIGHLTYHCPSGRLSFAMTPVGMPAIQIRAPSTLYEKEGLPTAITGYRLASDLAARGEVRVEDVQVLHVV